VALLTLHAAKGLEFPVVFMVGMEEGIFPHSRSKDDPEQMEEERRLAYVGVTRAKDKLYLTHVFKRMIYGREEVAEPSRFLADLPAELIDLQNPQSFRRERRRDVVLTPRRADSYRAQTRWDSPARPRRESKLAARPSGQFSIGDRVQHKAFGEGTVISVKDSGGEEMVAVAFPGKGIKQLLTSIAPLEKI
jgi:DNA helicase-2/ATP-dependent DNA helicase PcrA